MNLDGHNVSYLILSSKNIDDIMSVLWAKEYRIIPIKGFYKGSYEDSIIAESNIDNDELRNDVLFLINHFGHDSAIIKYNGDSYARKIFTDGSEKNLGLTLYNTSNENLSYICNGVSFSFIEEKRYWVPSRKEDFKIGMIVEYFNNEKWYKHEVKDPSNEYDNLFKLLIKYNKVRVLSRV